MWLVPRQRTEMDEPIEIRPQAGAPGFVRGIIGLLAREARSDPDALLAALHHKSALATPQDVVYMDRLGDRNRRRGRARHLLAALFTLTAEQPGGETLGADQLIDYPPFIRNTANAMIPEGADPHIARTLLLYLTIGRCSAGQAADISVPTLPVGPAAA